MPQGLGLQLRPDRITTTVKYEICISFGADHTPKKQNGGIPSTRNAAVGKMEI
jgi:hypothetical protein